MEKPRLELDRNNAGRAFIGVTEFANNGVGVRSFVLSSNHDGNIHDQVMKRRFYDMRRLMDGNIGDAIITDAFREGA